MTFKCHNDIIKGPILSRKLSMDWNENMNKFALPHEHEMNTIEEHLSYFIYVMSKWKICKNES